MLLLLLSEHAVPAVGTEVLGTPGGESSTRGTLVSPQRTHTPQVQHGASTSTQHVSSTPCYLHIVASFILCSFMFFLMSICYIHFVQLSHLFTPIPNGVNIIIYPIPNGFDLSNTVNTCLSHTMWNLPV